MQNFITAPANSITSRGGHWLIFVVQNQDYMPAINYTTAAGGRNRSFEIMPGRKAGDGCVVSVTRTVETPAGYYFYFREDEGIAEQLVTFISNERRKHTAFVFTLQFQEDILLLEITGPVGTNDRIMGMMQARLDTMTAC